MSTLKVEVVEIENILPHPNADRLELAQIKGWQCVVQKGAYKPGDTSIYIPIDSVLPEDIEAKLFGPESKVKLSKHRVKTIKLRGAISQGMLASEKSLGFMPGSFKMGADLTEILSITKYEPPAPGFQTSGDARPPRVTNPNFQKYTAIENIKNYNKLFQPEDLVVITEKIHGTNFRAGWVVNPGVTWLGRLWSRFREFLGVPRWVFVVGSHNTERQEDGENIYSDMARTLNLKEELHKDEVLYGEIYGPNIQKGYHYGVKSGERGFVAFDVKREGKYVDHDEFAVLCHAMKIQPTPVLFIGHFKDAKLDELIGGDSWLCAEQKTREGVVVKALYEESTYAGRKILKAINPEYLLKDNTDYH